MRTSSRAIPFLLMLASCASPPKPPAVDESLKRPANMPAAVELQTCRNDLYNARISVAESGRAAAHRAALLDRFSALQQVNEAREPQTVEPRPNRLYQVRFAFGSTQAVVPPSIAGPLLHEVRSAPLVVLRGRTDGTADNGLDARIARMRAVAVRDYLTAAGVNPARIRTTYQPTGDTVADNATSEGRAANRRVEIEVYREFPVPAGSPAPAS